jgi:hypothetical protein
MARTSATSVTDYIASLPKQQADAIAAVRKVLRANVPKGFEESMSTTGITYSIPLSRYPKTYNKQPLMYAAVAAQKNYCALYLLSAYGHEPHAKELREAFKTAGKKLDMGKSCIRFKTADDLELEVIGRLIGSITPEKWIEIYEASRKR